MKVEVQLKDLILADYGKKNNVNVASGRSAVETCEKENGRTQDHSSGRRIPAQQVFQEYDVFH